MEAVMTELLLFIFCFGVTITVNDLFKFGCNCNWQVYINGKGTYTLDLRTFAYENILIPIQINSTTYQYSPCNNRFQCKPTDYDQQGYMIIDKIYCTTIALYDYTVEPTLDWDTNSPMTAIWTFQYNNAVYISECDGYRRIIIKWQCNFYVNKYPYYYVVSMESLSKCLFTLKIDSIFACPSMNSTYIESNDVNQCVFYDSNNNFKYPLNLSLLHGVHTTFVAFNWRYYYSICQDDVTWTYNPTGKPPTGYYCAMINAANLVVLAFWDETVQPIYDVNDRSWFFTYYGWKYTNNVPYQQLSAQIWVYCDYQSNPFSIIPITTEKYNASVIKFKIHTIYACPQYLPHECLFYSNDKLLNLTELESNIIFGNDSSNKYSYYYSPCSNAASYQLCPESDDFNVMSVQYDISDKQCTRILALVNDTNYKVNYNYTGYEWTLYYNSSMNTTFTAHWICNQSAGNWSVTNAIQDSPSSYQMFIQSQFACV